VEKGGLFLKDAAVMAGLGIIGQNNLFDNNPPLYSNIARLRFFDVIFSNYGLF